MAIDGVAPRAKMNQQRARRFRSAQEARDLVEDENRIRTEMARRGDTPPDLKPPAWDSNVITPGTEFMGRLALYLRYYIHARYASEDPGTAAAWRDVKVILSDASVPGEGEHKLMDYVRRSREAPNFDPNTTHLLCGLDADLIMLALATHEAHFYILREEVLFGGKGAPPRCTLCTKPDCVSDMCPSRPKEQGGAGTELVDSKDAMRKPFQYVSIPLLREYLTIEFREEVR